MNLGFRINSIIERPEKSMIDDFSLLPSANVGDVLNRQFCISGELKKINSPKLCGPALTVFLRNGDNLLLYKAVQLAEKGDVIVVNAKGGMDNAIMGELILRWAESKGVAGFIINGAIRDIDYISKSTVPVYALGVTPAGPYKDGVGEINHPITIDNVVITPGDIVLGDDDGIVVINKHHAEIILNRAKNITIKEKDIIVDIENGAWNMNWLDERLKGLGCHIK
ncbi:RraA family protein [Aeromonas sp.]|uniref:RraA family protein n=1 Tax=Aeromonas sp. TaxID=647 RepID=UPI0025830F40|nr:RraA family protein [Aeromonas sp.]MCX7132099.1 RraA family protein [Aeromonas sp.]